MRSDGAGLRAIWAVGRRFCPMNRSLLWPRARRDTGRAMSQENVEVVRALFQAWNAGDMDAFRELYDPDAIMRMAENWPEPGPYFGREAIMCEFEQLRQTWDADAAEPITYRSTHSPPGRRDLNHAGTEPHPGRWC